MSSNVLKKHLTGLGVALAIGIAFFIFPNPSSPSVFAGSNFGNATYRTDLRATNSITYVLYFPLIGQPNACPYVPNEVYGSVAVINDPNYPPSPLPAEQNPDLNLALRGYTPVNATRGLIDIEHPLDPKAPQLPGLFADNRTAVFTATYQVHDWNWTTNTRGAPISDPPVTLAGLVTTQTETIRVPSSGYDIGRLPGGYEVMVLYASTNRITLKYTREDTVATGYTLHLENICVDPNLLAFYQSFNASGRVRLPAIYAGQGIGTAMGKELGVAIRDTGQFLDPRWRQDWWQGR